jgi:serine/threonine protein phosphatase PrpC
LPVHAVSFALTLVIINAKYPEDEVRGVQAEGFTHIGRRKNNEDYFLVDLKSGLFIVADGMGGHNAGEIASTLAAGTVQDFICQHSEGIPSAVVEAAVQAANEKILAQASQGTCREGMGTTLAVLWVLGSKAYIAHVGDSRIYLIRNGTIKRLTCDHSLVQEMVERGSLSELEARTHPQRNILTRAVGTESHPLVDVRQIQLDPNDKFLLCTDGLSGILRDEEILDLIESGSTVAEASSKLVNEVARKGGRDNITAIVVTVDDI